MYTNRSRYKRPAALADVSVGTTRSDWIVVGHIEIEDQLTLNRLECTRPYCFSVSGLYGTQLNKE